LVDSTENFCILKPAILEDKSLSIIPITELDTNDIPLLPSTIEGVITVCPTEYFEGFFVAKIKKQ
jgi:16S rRNA C967 or C1407 C5-methylase (RsmB/RsmF family)